VMGLPAIVADASAPGLWAETRPARPVNAIKSFLSVLINRYYTGCRPLGVLGCSLRQDHRIRTAHSLQKELHPRGESDGPSVGQFRDRAADDGGRLGPRPEPQAVLTLGCWTEGLSSTAIRRDDLLCQAVNFRIGREPFPSPFALRKARSRDAAAATPIPPHLIFTMLKRPGRVKRGSELARRQENLLRWPRSVRASSASSPSRLPRPYRIASAGPEQWRRCTRTMFGWTLSVACSHTKS